MAWLGLSYKGKGTGSSGLRHLTMACGIPVVAAEVADTEGSKADWVRLRNMRGPSVVAYECDMWRVKR